MSATFPRIGIPTLLLLLGLNACSSEEARSDHRFEIVSEDGNPTALNHGGPKYADELFRYTLHLRLVEDPAVPASLLYQPDFHYVLGEDGCYYIADAGNSRVAVFDGDGRFVRSFGRRGNGPGEFTRPRILTFEDGVLGLWDNFQRRTIYYRTDGSYLDDIFTPNIRSRINGLHRDSEGRVIALYFDFREGEGFQYNGRRVVVTSVDGDTLTDMMTPLLPTAFLVRGEGVSGAGGLPYGPDPTIKLLPGGRLLRSTGAEPLLEIFDVTGRPLRRIRLDLPREKVTADERAAIRGHLQAEADTAGTGRAGEFSRAMVAGLRFPEEKAHWSSVEVDEAGYFWLAFSSPLFTVGSGDQTSYRLLSPEGEYLGDSARPGMIVSTVSRSHLLTWEYDPESGALTPVVFRISPAVPGFEYP